MVSAVAIAAILTTVTRAYNDDEYEVEASRRLIAAIRRRGPLEFEALDSMQQTKTQARLQELEQTVEGRGDTRDTDPALLAAALLTSDPTPVQSDIAWIRARRQEISTEARQRLATLLHKEPLPLAVLVRAGTRQQVREQRRRGWLALKEVGQRAIVMIVIRVGLYITGGGVIGYVLSAVAWRLINAALAGSLNSADIHVSSTMTAGGVVGGTAGFVNIARRLYIPPDYTREADSARRARRVALIALPFLIIFGAAAFTLGWLTRWAEFGSPWSQRIANNLFESSNGVRLVCCCLAGGILYGFYRTARSRWTLLSDTSLEWQKRLENLAGNLFVWPLLLLFGAFATYFVLVPEVLLDPTTQPQMPRPARLSVSLSIMGCFAAAGLVYLAEVLLRAHARGLRMRKYRALGLQPAHLLHPGAAVGGFIVALPLIWWMSVLLVPSLNTERGPTSWQGVIAFLLLLVLSLLGLPAVMVYAVIQVFRRRDEDQRLAELAHKQTGYKNLHGESEEDSNAGQ